MQNVINITMSAIYIRLRYDVSAGISLSETIQFLLPDAEGYLVSLK
jgi:hypothetical protein